ncbi:MAG: glutamate racemase [Muribaculaceae bacterium]|nr:glutamate racemase [Muribaculaceae bacterium]MDE5969150.1 glutamate racemase [Muribaculaceae bacterium]
MPEKSTSSFAPLDSALKCGPIGVFDSGYGGLTILKDLQRRLPEFDYVFLGDNARAPYGNRSFDIVYRFTLEAVDRLMNVEGCPLVILACNTASAKALRTIQQNDLPTSVDPSRRVLGVIRPTVERLGALSESGHIGIFGTPGTIRSESYNMEIAKLFPRFKSTGRACPMWVPLVENGEADSPGADYFVKQEIERLLADDPDIDAIILGCTHYPHLLPKIKKYLPQGINLIAQGEIVADSLDDYLHRHPEMAERLTRGGSCRYLTTENPAKFSEMASKFIGTDIAATEIKL